MMNYNPYREFNGPMRWQEYLGITLAVMMGIPIWLCCIGILAVSYAWERTYNAGAIYGTQGWKMTSQNKEGLAMTIIVILGIAAGVAIGCAPFAFLAWWLL